jgi:hypothetical protein
MLDLEIKILEKGKKLYRANKSNAKNAKNTTIKASNNYKGLPFKYFTLTKNETNTYKKYGTTYTKSWLVTDNINLIDILNYDTRLQLENKFTKPREKMALNSAFPIKHNTVSRNSNVDIDNIVLNKICELGYDGYYMRRLNNNGSYVFHSEVGLCSSAFSKLQLTNSEKKNMPNRLTKKKPNGIVRNTSGISVALFR